MGSKPQEKYELNNEGNEGADLLHTYIASISTAFIAYIKEKQFSCFDSDEAIVGTKDGSVHTIIWNESAWETFRDKLTGNDKVLIIGKIKTQGL